MNVKEAFDEYKIDYPFNMTQIIYDKDMEHGDKIDKKVDNAELDKEFASLKTAEKEAMAIGVDPQAVAIDIDDGQVLKPIAEQQYDQVK